ncbi:MAG: endonuclease domain-containing protein, partial [Gemmataceae bacterium]|nr:endonuclease domain-containing protein [Gemmataceae bacterium]
AFVDAARAVRRGDPADVADDFRSVHERFLFEQLESLPETAGLFRPNRPLPFRHGPQAAEADLVAEGLKVVVEVDGTHYHLNQPQYRRDRRKDWEYQRHGYLVLRFLAEDVVDDLETILATVLDAVAFRRDRPPPER